MADGKSTIGCIFTWIWRIVTGVYRAVAIVLILVVLGLLWLDLRGGPPVHVDKNVALVIKPAGALVDQPPSSAQRLINRLGDKGSRETSLRTLRLALRHAAEDPRIKLAVLDFDDMTGAGVAQLQELSRSVAAFRNSGKKVYAYGLSFNQYQYLPAVQADSVSLDPMGVVMLQGFGVYSHYFKDALDKLGIKINVFRVGAFKSAVEPFIRNDMSPDAKLANKAWLGDLWSSYQGAVTSRRKLPADALDNYIAGFSDALAAAHGNGAKVALVGKLVDKVQTRGQFRESMDALVGKDDDTGSFRQILARNYMQAWAGEHGGDKHGKNIGVIVVSGDIVDGKSSYNSAGGDTIAYLLGKATRDDSVAAVVLRVNSPGGSVVAAEKIRRAELRLKQSGKPLVVSMSTLAASGGYWISMDADSIFAEPTTITGSIGIFGLLPNITQPLDKLGIHGDGVGTSPLAGAFRISRPLTQPERDIIQSQVDYGYTLFTQGVAAGRKLPLAKVKKIAQGRVWSGAAAQKLGLVDHFGGLHAALSKAATLAGLNLKQYRVKRFDRQPSLLQLVSEQFGVHAKAETLTQVAASTPWLKPFAEAAQTLRHFNDPKGQYAYCFCKPVAAPNID